MKKLIVIACGLLLAAGLGGCASLNMNRVMAGAEKAMQAASITDAQMASYVHQSVEQMDAQNKVLSPSNRYSVRLRKLTQGITDADGIPLNFKVYQTDQVNAFACPDGSVRVYTGIMDLMNDDELLGIIGHEVGHVIKRHSKKALQNQLLTSAALDGLASTNNTVAALTDSELGAIGSLYMNAQYSQKQESEADNCGYDFLVAHGKNPWCMVRSFEKMLTLEQQQGQQQGTLAKAFSDHPDTQSRIRALTGRCIKDGYKRP